jgi:hypothetical protein
MASSRIICAVVTAFTMGAGAGAAAQSLVPGSKAPAEVVQQLKDVPSVNIGKASVRPVVPQPDAATPPEAALKSGRSVPAAGGTTFVVRSSDNLVGVSTNDLVVIYRDTAAISQAVAGKDVSAQAYPDMGLVVLHVGSFDQLAPLKTALSAKFPAAKFDLPVRYFATTPK